MVKIYDYNVADFKDTNQKECSHRRFEKKDGEDWVEVKMKDLKRGDVFRFFNGNKLVIDRDNYSEFVVSISPRISELGLYYMTYSFTSYGKDHVNIFKDNNN
jgi:hypothetical protein